MAVVEQAYSPQIYNANPDLQDANESLVGEGGVDLVRNLFQPLIQKHKVEALLGVGLLHRHFGPQDDERLVEFNNISIPWRHQQGDGQTGGQLLPSAWLVKHGGLMPYEFYYSPLGRDRAIELSNLTSFLSEFVASIQALELSNTIALRFFPGVGFTGAMEMTEGRANINLTPD